MSSKNVTTTAMLVKHCQTTLLKAYVTIIFKIYISYIIRQHRSP